MIQLCRNNPSEICLQDIKNWSLTTKNWRKIKTMFMTMMEYSLMITERLTSSPMIVNGFPKIKFGILLIKDQSIQLDFKFCSPLS